MMMSTPVEKIETVRKPDRCDSDDDSNIIDVGENEPTMMENHSQVANAAGAAQEMELTRNPTIHEGTVPLKDSKIRYLVPESDQWQESEFIGRGGKATGANKNYYNIWDNDGVLRGLNLEFTWQYENEEVLISMEIK